jgi:N-acetylglucosaminyl-diphospho-decaprenol L-rhamnosyltransferase
VKRSLIKNLESFAGRTPSLTVVIVNYDSWPEVRRLVATLEATTEVATGTCEVIVVDNASPGRPPADLLQAPFRGTRILAQADNGGFSAGVNAGWQAARSRWLLVLNPDVLIPEGKLGSIVARIARYEADPARAPGIVGFKLLNPDGTRQPSVGAFPSLVRTAWEQLIPRSRRKYQPGWRTRPGPVAWVTGACMLLNTHMLDMLGGMDEDFFLYYEEVDLCRSAQNRSWSVQYDEEVEVVHLHPLQNRAISPRMRVITRHSKLLYFRKHLPRWQFLTLSRIISLEAIIRRTGSMVQGRTDDGRAWRTIGEMARAFRAGLEPRGRQVLTLADSVIAAPLPVPRGSLEGSHPTPPIVPAGKRRGTSAATLLKPRKDGPACR